MFDQDHGLIHPFTAKDNQHLITNLHLNNSNDVLMFPLQSWSHLRRAEHRKLGQLCSIRSSVSRENYQGVPLNTRSLEISEKLLAAIQNLFVYCSMYICNAACVLHG